MPLTSDRFANSAGSDLTTKTRRQLRERDPHEGTNPSHFRFHKTLALPSPPRAFYFQLRFRANVGSASCPFAPRTSFINRATYRDIAASCDQISTIIDDADRTITFELNQTGSKMSKRFRDWRPFGRLARLRAGMTTSRSSPSHWRNCRGPLLSRGTTALWAVDSALIYRNVGSVFAGNVLRFVKNKPGLAVTFRSVAK